MPRQGAYGRRSVVHLVQGRLSLSLLHRRHLSEGQRAMIAAEISNLPKGVRAARQLADVTEPQAARVMNVRVRSVRSAVSHPCKRSGRRCGLFLPRVLDSARTDAEMQHSTHRRHALAASHQPKYSSGKRRLLTNDSGILNT